MASTAISPRTAPMIHNLLFGGEIGVGDDDVVEWGGESVVVAEDVVAVFIDVVEWGGVVVETGGSIVVDGDVVAVGGGETSYI